MEKRPNLELKKFYAGKNVLITGGAGFIGSSLAIALTRLGSEVAIIDSMLQGMGGNLFNLREIKDNIHLNISDIADRNSMDFLIKEKDVLFNMAGTLSHIDSMQNPIADLKANCESQLSLLESARHNNPSIKIVYAGTRNQYGKAQYLPVDEMHPMFPTDINGINCIAGESYHLLYHRVYGVKACSLRMSNTYGPRHQMKHAKQGVLNWFVRQALDNQLIKLYGTGEQIRDCNYIDDVVEALLLLGASELSWGEVFNIGGSPISLKGFVIGLSKVCKNVKFEIAQFPEDRKIIEIGDYIADTTKLKTQIGWRPSYSIEQGIVETVEYYSKYRKNYW